jgi:hypothetical protein
MSSFAGVNVHQQVKRNFHRAAAARRIAAMHAVNTCIAACNEVMMLQSQYIRGKACAATVGQVVASDVKSAQGAVVVIVSYVPYVYANRASAHI